MQLFSIFHKIRIQDVLDIFFLTFMAYHLFIWFYETKAFKALIGLLGLGIIYTVVESWGLFLTSWMFQILWQVLVLMLIILFQTEIRQVLERVNPFQPFMRHPIPFQLPWVENLAGTVFIMAEKQLGALLLIERNDRLKEYISGGIPMTAEPSKEILLSIFQKHSPLHDGATIIRNGKIVMTACFLPLTLREGLPKEWGTRHRSAIGITERCDAWALVVSEERSVVSLGREGRLEAMDTPEQLVLRLAELSAVKKTDDRSPFKKVVEGFISRWQLKLAVLGSVSIAWFAFAGQQDVQASFNVPVEFQNLSPELEVVSLSRPSVTITTRGMRKDIGPLNSRNVQVKIDLSGELPGRRAFVITRRNIYLQNERVDVVNITPNVLTIEIGPRRAGTG